MLAIQGSVTEDGRAQQGVFTWIWTGWSHQPPPDLGKQQPWSLCSTALMPGQGEGQEEQLHEGTLPPKWGGKKAFPFPPGTGSCARKATPLQGRQRTQPHVSGSGSSASRQMQLEGWSNPTTFPLKRLLTLQEQRTEPPSCSLHRDFGTRASSWGSAGFTKDGHGNAREHGCGRAAQIPRWAGVAMQQSSNEDTTPWAQVKPRIKELVHPRTLVTCKRRSTPKLGFIQHSLTECPKAEST